MPTQVERQAKTKQSIIDALIKIGSTKPLSRITVSDITRVSHINRGTFYLHYFDKDDLITQIHEQLYGDFRQILSQEMDGSMNIRILATGKPYPIVEDIIQLASNNKELLKFLFSSNGDPTFYPTITQMLQAAIFRELKRIKGTANFRPDMPNEYAIRLIPNTIMTIVIHWIESDEDLDTDTIAHLIMRALYLSPYEMLGIKPAQ